jgi:hypothetical protein
MLISTTVDEESSPVALTAFSDFAVDSIIVDIADAEANDYKDYLFVITAGTLVDETIIIRGNDASTEGGTTKLYFAHAATSTLTALKVTAANLVSPDYYLTLVYKGNYTEFSATTEEVPITNTFERRVMKAGLMKIGYERLQGPKGAHAILWRNNFEEVIQQLRDEFFSRPVKVRSRKWAGLIDDDSLDTDEEEDEDE